MQAKYPVFIIGSPRSGTSVLVGALLGAGYNGYREGNFLQLMPMISGIIDRHYNTFGHDGPDVLISHINSDSLKGSINEIFARFVNELHHAGEPWVDKSGNPEMINAIPDLLKLWPGSQFIFAKRRAIENIVSRLTKFSHHNFEYHCQDWARNMQSWRLMRDRVPLVNRLEVDQQEIIRDPVSSGAKIASFLDLSAERRDKIVSIFTNDRPQETSAGTAERVLTLSELWEEPQRAIFRKICGPEMQAFGYTFDERYWNTEAAPLRNSDL